MRAAADESSPRITRQSSVPSGPSLLKDQSNCYAERGRGPGPRMSVSGHGLPSGAARWTAVTPSAPDITSRVGLNLQLCFDLRWWKSASAAIS